MFTSELLHKHIKVLEIVFLCLCMNICYVFVCVYACPDLSELPVSSVHHRARRRRERVSESPSRWKSQSKGSAVPKKHHTAPLLTFWSHPRGGREATHFLNRIKTWRQAAPILLHAIDYTLVWSGVLSGTPWYWALFFWVKFLIQLRIIPHLNIRQTYWSK